MIPPLGPRKTLCVVHVKYPHNLQDWDILAKLRNVPISKVNTLQFCILMISLIQVLKSITLLISAASTLLIYENF